MVTKNNEWGGRRNGNEPMMRNTSGNRGIDVPFLDLNVTRRQMMQQAAYASLLLAFPWADQAFAAVPPPPQISFLKNKTGDGIVGPFGEVRIYNVGGQVLPIIVSAKNGYAAMNFTGRTPFVRIGRAGDSTTITLTGFGVQFGAAKPLKWSAIVINEMIKAIVRDPYKVSGAMELRSALHTSYPVANMVLLPKYTMGKQMAAVISNGAVGLGAGAMNTSTANCKVMTVTEAVTRTITETVNVILTALQQYQACYDSQIARDPCRSAGIFAGACAAGICGVKAFVDIVTGTITVVTDIVEEVTREVMVCVAHSVNRWPNPWNPTPTILQGAVPQPKQVIDILGALNFLRSILTVIGSFAKCLLDGKWSLAQLQTPLNIGGQSVLPYGVKVCITSECAKRLALQGIGSELANSWSYLLGVLAALDKDFAQIAAGFGIVPVGAVVAAVAALNPAAVPAIVTGAGIILAFIILVMWHATAISAQLAVQVCCTTNLGDGLVCIEHPTLAVALIAIPLFAYGGLNLVLIPPIVTG